MKTIIRIETTPQDIIMKIRWGNYQLNIELENTGVKDDWNYIIHIIARIMHGKSLVNSIVIEGTDIGIWIDKGKTPRDFTLVKLMR